MTMRNNESPKLHKNKIRHAEGVAVNRREKYEERQSHRRALLQRNCVLRVRESSIGKKASEKLNGKVGRNMKFFPKLGYRLKVAWLLESWCESDKSWKRVESYGNPYDERIESLRRIINFCPNSRIFALWKFILRAALAHLLRSTFIFNFLLFLYFRFSTFIIFLNIFNILNIG